MIRNLDQRLDDRLPAAMVAAGDASLPAGQKAGLMPSKSNEDIIERSLNSILDSHEKTIERIKSLEADVAEARENAERAARNVPSASTPGAWAHLRSALPARPATARALEVASQMGHPDPVALVARETWLRNWARLQLDGWRGEADRLLSEMRALEAACNQKAYLNENTASQGGAAVPTFVAGELYRLVEQHSVVRRVARQIPVPTRVNTLVTGASSVTAYVIGELGTTITSGEPTVGSAVLTVKDWVAYGNATLDILQDEAVGLMDFFLESAAEQIGKMQDQAALEGTAGASIVGVGTQTTTSTPTIGKIVRIDTTTATNAPTVPSIAHLYSLVASVPKAARVDAAWIMHPLTWAKIASQTSSALAVLGANALYISPNPSDAVSEGSLLGYRVFTSDQIATATEGAKCYFGNWRKGVVLGQRQTFEFAVTQAEKFAQGLVSMRVIERLGGVVSNPEALGYLGKCPYSA